MATSTKEIIVKVIPVNIANDFVRKNHYSGKVATTTQLSFGCFLHGGLHGVMQLASSINKKASVNLVTGTGWNEFIELGRLAFDDVLPRNSESRCISVMIKLLKKKAPQIKWLLSYADGTQCGDGAIYRASGFDLIGINKNASMWLMPDGEVCMNLIFDPSFAPNSKNGKAIRYGKVGRFASWPATRFLKEIGAKPLEGFQLKYIYFLDPTYKAKLSVPILPYSAIAEAGAKMYKGKKGGSSVASSTVGDQPTGGGAIPTDPLQGI